MEPAKTVAVGAGAEVEEAGPVVEVEDDVGMDVDVEDEGPVPWAAPSSSPPEQAGSPPRAATPSTTAAIRTLITRG
ncbi:MAG: hypothetical protein ACRDZ9_07115 [Acidimicrobiales bacterium]